MAQWWERSLSTIVSRVRFLDPALYVGWVCCSISFCCERFLPGFFGLPLSSKTNISKSQFYLGKFPRLVRERQIHWQLKKSITIIVIIIINLLMLLLLNVLFIDYMEISFALSNTSDGGMRTDWLTKKYIIRNLYPFSITTVIVISIYDWVFNAINMHKINCALILGFHPREFCLDDGCYLPCWCPNKLAQ